jgi:hypothetical protein
MNHITKQMYSADKVESIYDYLKKHYDKGKPFEYKILVDNSEVVHRTDDPDNFMHFERFVDGNTKWVEIVVYTAQKTCTRDMFILDPVTLEKEQNNVREQGLSGVELEDKIQSVVLKEKEKWNDEQQRKDLEKENRDLKEEIQELESDYEKLQKELDDLKESASPLKGVLGELGSAAVESFFRRNPHVLAEIPIAGKALEGFFVQDNKRLLGAAQQPGDETEVNVSRVNPEERPTLTEEDKTLLVFLRQLREAFPKEQFEKIIRMLQSLLADPSNIDPVLELLDDTKKEKL